MESAVNYIVESAIGLGIFALYYRLGLKNKADAWFNRLFILTVLVVITVLPFLHFHLPITPTQATGILLPQVGTDSTNWLDMVTIVSNTPGEWMVDLFHNLPWLTIIYLTGFLFAMAKLMVALWQIRWFSQSPSVDETSEVRVVDVDSHVAPFSFFKWLFVNSKRYQPHELEMIMEHEQAHIKLYHSYDMVLLELILILQWFNPFVWLLRRDLREVHEFQADRMTLQAGVNPEIYKQLLVVEALGTNFDLGHSFSHSLIQKRLKMLNKKTSGKVGFVKPMVSLAFIMLIVFFMSIDRAEASSGNPLSIILLGNSAVADSVYEHCEVMPEFPGGMNAMMEYLGTSIQFPVKANEAGTSARVMVSFIVDKAGKIGNVKVIQCATQTISGKDTIYKVTYDENATGANDFEKEAIRVVQTMPRWKAGTQSGKPVDVHFTLPVMFLLGDAKPFMVPPPPPPVGDQVPPPPPADQLASVVEIEEPFVVVEQMPEFPGGQPSLMSYLSQNIQYPQEAVKAKKEGTCYLRFIVDKEGQVRDPKIIRSSGTECLDNEAIRIVKAMPKWNPGMQGGQNVNVSYTLPVRFALK